jgi:hypothetical protein
MQDRHQGRRATRASLAITQNPATFLHLQHACMVHPPEDWLPARSGESVPGSPGNSPVALWLRPGICWILVRLSAYAAYPAALTPGRRHLAVRRGTPRSRLAPAARRA